ncbi:DUF7167 family protein [Psychrobacter aquimaris]|uniref:DUF7167 family protein n=1 Tax=Psychrobacter aquimaris TaxID=292733 RepID=UPI003FD5EE0C
MRVKFYLSIGLAGATRTDIVEMPDDSSENDIEEEYQTWKNDYIEGYWDKISEVADD